MSMKLHLATPALSLAAALLVVPAAGWASDAPAQPAAASPLAQSLAAADAAKRGQSAGATAALPAARAAERAGQADKASEAAKSGRAADASKTAPRPPDPMAHLRDRLAEKLGATKAPEAGSRNVVQVVAKAQGGAEPVAQARRAAGHAAGHTAGLVAKLRAEKAAAGGRAAAGVASYTGHWAYAGAGGPEDWGALKPEFAKCGNGSRQSPIDIRGEIKVDLEPIQFQYRPSSFRVLDNGHTVQVGLSGGNSIEVMGRRYDLVQFHFHRPSEERIDGRQFDMSAHLVHRDPEGRLAVVAVLLDRGSAHPLVQSVWNNLPLEKGLDVPAQVLLDPTHLLPADRRYFTYMGSLTTPPCSEGVLWMVMQQPVPLSSEQVAVFSRLYPMNARPVQSAAGRLIKGSY